MFSCNGENSNLGVTFQKNDSGEGLESITTLETMISVADRFLETKTATTVNSFLGVPSRGAGARIFASRNVFNPMKLLIPSGGDELGALALILASMRLSVQQICDFNINEDVVFLIL